ncbi:mitochondrial 37S ribosomal protein NAM9 [Arthroderma uncinatum]|uniref:mitochondrial 37S ribosomal protein NAM9 n=1 Tax=Arthroderma uncinatum TaxID=74035 RepID=UPI00144A6AD7|nr:mitochondrial 37S ribosomal protein NAM9 [Arthroderma uncinatum]KAF3483669.1 mitochondrial 37S ribosomal protein NAM9 [Arthroderma uncinatum]
MRNKATNYLRRPKFRQSWSKYNLFNLTRITNPFTAARTAFQQKWKAKSITRAYHGEQVRESQWERMFSRRPRAVVSLNARYLARNDGSSESAGRGSGLQRPPVTGPKRAAFEIKATPYTQMTYAPLERRLDVAIFRALFASSTRQARQFVIHGAVKVNGKKMQHAGYLLNPGDMFQVEPERVMYATGAPKDGSLRRSGRIRRRLGPKKEGEEGEEGEGAKSAKSAEKKEDGKKTEEPEDPRRSLKDMLSAAKELMATGKKVLPAKRRQEFRAFQRSVKQVLSRSSTTTTMTDNLEAQFLALKNMMEEQNKAAEKAAAEAAQKAAASEASKSEAAAPSIPSTESHTIQEQPPMAATPFKNNNAFADFTDSLAQTDLDDSSAADLRALKRALEELHDNPIDSTKPYATPWRPRDYMSPFAFVPRYLEVNHNICAAVYLRHPVARPGMAEVPTPYGEIVGSAAFAWYLRRR